MRRLALVAALAGMLLTSVAVEPALAAAPAATTGSAQAITASSATVAGTVNPAGAATNYSFQYGPTTSYGLQTAPQSAGSGTSAAPVSATISGLTPASTYHYRVTATSGATTVPGADQTFTTPGKAAASALAAAVDPAGGNTAVALNLTIGADPAGTPAGQVSTVAEAFPTQFSNQLASLGSCAAASFNNAQGPTAANCPDRSAVIGVGTLVTRSQSGSDATSDQGFIVKTTGNQVVFWWHAPATATSPASFGQATGTVTQEAGPYGPVVSYAFNALPAGARIRQLNLTYQPATAAAKAPFAASSCAGGSWSLQARIAYAGGVPAEMPVTTAPCGEAPQPSKLQLARATLDPVHNTIDILAPISRRASGRVSLELFAAHRRFRWTAAINSNDGRIRNRQSIPAAQARFGTGILTIRYAGNAVTRPQTVRLRAANGQSRLDASRPTLVGAHLHDQGTVVTSARGIVRVQLEYFSGGQTTTLERHARITGGRWTLDVDLTAAQQAAIAQRRGTVQSYILFTGYLPRRLRGEMVSYQVLDAR
ncbi:MAG: fibronectin type III domain-containing protein [Solirubrobacteraceae bacterium]